MNIFVCWQSLLLALFIYGATELSRRLVQSLWKGWRKSALYNEFFLWGSPMALGYAIGIGGFGFPWPVDLTSPSARAMYAFVIGMFCGLAYNRARRLLTTWTVEGAPGSPGSKH